MNPFYPAGHEGVHRVHFAHTPIQCSSNAIQQSDSALIVLTAEHTETSGEGPSPNPGLQWQAQWGLRATAWTGPEETG